MKLEDMKQPLANYTWAKIQGMNFKESEHFMAGDVPELIYNFIRENYQGINQARNGWYVWVIQQWLVENKLKKEDLYYLWNIVRFVVEKYQKTLPDYINFYQQKMLERQKGKH